MKLSTLMLAFAVGVAALHPQVIHVQEPAVATQTFSSVTLGQAQMYAASEGTLSNHDLFEQVPLVRDGKRLALDAPQPGVYYYFA